MLTLNETFPLEQASYMVGYSLSRSFAFFDAEHPMARRYAVLNFELAQGALVETATREIDYCCPRLLLYTRCHKTTQCR